LACGTLVRLPKGNVFFLPCSQQEGGVMTDVKACTNTKSQHPLNILGTPPGCVV
jgi:hypothetical protein